MTDSVTVTVADLFDYNSAELGLVWIAGRESSERKVAHTTAEPADLIGHLNLIHPGRMHVLGQPELEFFTTQDASRRQAILDDLIAGRGPAGTPGAA